MKRKFLPILTILFCTVHSVHSQYGVCNDNLSASGEIYTVDSYEMFCLARESEKEHTLVYTYASWCGICKYYLHYAIKLAKDYDLEFYVLLIDEEDSNEELAAIDYLAVIQEKYNFEFDIKRL